MRLKLGISKQKVRRRWTRDQSNALWVGDFEDGPYVIDGDRAKETHLCAFIDCHSRYAIDARYYYRENLDVLIDSLLRAWANHGASRELYADNAKIYHANALKTACLALNIKLLHRAPSIHQAAVWSNASSKRFNRNSKAKCGPGTSSCWRSSIRPFPPGWK